MFPGEKSDSGQMIIPNKDIKAKWEEFILPTI